MGQYTFRNIRDVISIRELDNVRDKTSYAIQSQYSASKRILSVSEQFQKHLCPEADIKLFYDKMFNIRTAEGIGLDVWGRILGINRTIVDPDTRISIVLDDDYFRLLLFYKALANISKSTAYSQNVLLNTLVNTGVGGFNGASYVLEVDTMVIRWTFEYFLDDTQKAIFKIAGTLARGAGVGWELYAINPDEVFGFDKSEMQPFNQAPFAPDDALILGK
jgi:Protein of unknown function (DUF2612).